MILACRCGQLTYHGACRICSACGVAFAAVSVKGNCNLIGAKHRKGMIDKLDFAKGIFRRYLVNIVARKELSERNIVVDQRQTCRYRVGRNRLARGGSFAIVIINSCRKLGNSGGCRFYRSFKRK